MNKEKTPPQQKSNPPNDTLETDDIKSKYIECLFSGQKDDKPFEEKVAELVNKFEECDEIGKGTILIINFVGTIQKNHVQQKIENNQNCTINTGNNGYEIKKNIEKESQPKEILKKIISICPRESKLYNLIDKILTFFK